MGKIEPSQLGFDIKGRNYLRRRIQEPQFTFALNTRETPVKLHFQLTYPDITAHVADLIPKEKLFVHRWKREGYEVLVHYNDAETRMLHARPKSKDLSSPLEGITVHPEP
jgi:hypothetical protein